MGLLDNCPAALIRPFDECLKLAKLPEAKSHSKHCFAYHDYEYEPSSSKEGRKKESKKDLKKDSKRTSFRDRYAFCCRRSERDYYLRKYPNKIAVIVERSKNERVLGELDRGLFIVPAAMTTGQLQNVIRKELRNDLNLIPLYLLINGCFLPSNSLTMAELAYKHSCCDGFVYATYSSNEVAG